MSNINNSNMSNSSDPNMNQSNDLNARVYHANTHIYNFHGHNTNHAPSPPPETYHGRPNFPPPYSEQNQVYPLNYNHSFPPPSQTHHGHGNMPPPHLIHNQQYPRHQFNILPPSSNWNHQQHHVPHLSPNLNILPRNLPGLPVNYNAYQPSYPPLPPFREPPQTMNRTRSELNPNALSFYPSIPSCDDSQITAEADKIKLKKNKKTKKRNLRKKLGKLRRRMTLTQGKEQDAVEDMGSMIQSFEHSKASESLLSKKHTTTLDESIEEEAMFNDTGERNNQSTTVSNILSMYLIKHITNLFSMVLIK